jgi:hypothetical protein
MASKSDAPNILEVPRMKRSRRQLSIAAAFFVAAPNLALNAATESHHKPAPVPSPKPPPPSTSSGGVSFPLRVHASRRFLADSAGQPFFLHADASWSIAVQLTRTQIDSYLDDRQRRGFNGILFNVIEHYFSSNKPFYRNIEGKDPFAPMTDFSSPNPAYWQLVDYVVEGCAQRGIVCLLAPAYLGVGGGSSSPNDEGWDSEVNKASNADLQRYGAFLANRYTQRNIIWILGGDYNPPNAAKQWNIASGIRSVDPSALITGHGSRNTESYTVWNGQSGWNLNNIYVNLRGVAQPASEIAYGRPGPIPFFLIEGAYGGAQTDAACRLQVYQSILSGACGHCFGTFPIWGFGEPHANGGIGPATALRTSLDTPATRQMTYVRRLVLGYAWWKLVPRTDSSLVTTSLGSGTLRICPALASDHSFAMVWTTESRFSLNMAALATPSIRCRWYDPLEGAFTAVSDSPVANTGIRAFSPPGEGVLVLDAA